LTSEEKETIKDIVNENIYDVLDELGVDYIDHGDYLNARCPIHNGDNPTAFSWSLSCGSWKCFTKSCEEKHGKDIFGLVMGIKKLSFDKMETYLMDLMNLDKNNIVCDPKRKNEMYERSLVRKNKLKKLINIEKEALEGLIPSSCMVERGFDAGLLKSYGIGECSGGWVGGVPKTDKWHGLFNPRIIFPVADDEGGLIGWSARKINENDNPKWLPNPGFKKTLSLYNIDRAKDSIAKTTVAIVCEGPIDVLRLVQNNVWNTVSIFGTSISNEQIKLLVKHGAFTVIILLDNDEAGILASNKIEGRLSDLFTVVNLTGDLPDNSDVGDLSSEEISHYVKKELSKIQ